MDARPFLFTAGLALLAASSGRAQNTDALTSLMAHSDAVVVATSVESRLGMRSGANYVGEYFKDVVTLSGETMPQDLHVNFVRELRDDSTPCKPGQRFILFLKRYHMNAWYWELSDDLFGCQPYTHGLEYSVSEAAKPR